jgi:26S proteasome regulatory subunit N1
MAVTDGAKKPEKSTSNDVKGKKEQKKEDPDADLSEEDLELKTNIGMMVERVKDTDAGVQKLALDSITKEIHTTTTSMTAVPKPLKFLRPHMDTMIAHFEQMPAGPNKQSLADILSLLCCTVAGKEGEQQGLSYKLQVHYADN